MKYLSIDIETTGVDSENHQILSIGVIVEDTLKKLPFEEIPKFHCGIVRKEIKGDLFALNLNRDLIQTINTWNNASEETRKKIEEKENMIFCTEDEVVKHLFRFLFLNNILDKSILPISSKEGQRVEFVNGVSYPTINLRTPKSKFNAAGKNFGNFDRLFLEKLPRWKDVFEVNRRYIDPTILFTDWQNDLQLPDLTKCKERAKTGGKVTHNAIDDAWDVIELLRTQY